MTDARRRQIEAERRTEATRADEEDARLLDLLLPRKRHFRHDEMTAVAPDLIGGEFHFIRSLSRVAGEGGGGGNRAARD